MHLFMTAHFRIIAACYQFTKITQSSIAFALTTLLLNGQLNVYSSTVLTLNGVLTVFMIQLRLYPYLLVIDLMFKTSKLRKYGSSPISIFLTMLLIFILIVASFIIGFLIFFSFCKSFSKWINCYTEGDPMTKYDIVTIGD